MSQTITLPNGTIVSRPSGLSPEISAYLEALAFSANQDAIRAEAAALSVGEGVVEAAAESAAEAAVSAASAAGSAANSLTSSEASAASAVEAEAQADTSAFSAAASAASAAAAAASAAAALADAADAENSRLGAVTSQGQAATSATAAASSASAAQTARNAAQTARTDAQAAAAAAAAAVASVPNDAAIRALVADMLVAGDNVTLSFNSTTGKLTVNASGVSPATAPVNTALPSLSGSTALGSTLAANPGVYAGNPTPTITRVWQRNGVNIAGATGVNYTITAPDQGTDLRIIETATNVAGSTFATSLPLAIPAAPAAPANTALPTISGSTSLGATLTVTPGTYTGSPAPALTRQWQRNGVNIAGATGLTYVITATDQGTTLRVAETATNASGAITNNSAGTTIPSAGVAPGALQSLAATATSAFGIQMTGTAPATGTTPFTYEYRFVATGGLTGTALTNALNAAAIFAFGGLPTNATGLTPSTAYTFEVRAVNTQGNGPWTRTTAATIAAVTPSPDAYLPTEFTKQAIPTTPVAGVTFAPVLPNPSGANDVASIQFFGPAGTPVTSRYITMMHAFAPGQLLVTDQLDCFRGGTAFPVQRTVHSTHLDGSVKLAILSMLAPAWNGTTPTTAMLRKGAAAPTGSTVVVNSSNFTGSMTLDNRRNSAGTAQSIGTVYDFSPTTLNATGGSDFWQQGPICTQRRFTIPCLDAVRIIVDVSRYVDGSEEVVLEIRADGQMWTQAHNATSWTISAVLNQGGSPIFSLTSHRLWQNQIVGKHAHSANTTTANSVNDPVEMAVQIDAPEYSRLGFLPPYDYSYGMTATGMTNLFAEAAGYGSSFRSLDSTGGIRSPNMGGGGGTGHLGPLPKWVAGFFVTGDYRLRQTVLATAEGQRQLPINQYDLQRGQFLNIFPTIGRPNIWFDYRDTDALTAGYHPYDGGCGRDWSGAHQPLCAYAGFLLTGRRCYYDALMMQTAWETGYCWSGVRQMTVNGITKDWGITQVQQPREAGWTLRGQADGLNLMRDGDPLKQPVYDLLKWNIDYLLAESPSWAVLQQEIVGFLPKSNQGNDANGKSEIKPWMQDHVMWGIFRTWVAGIPGTRDLVRKFFGNFFIKRHDFADDAMMKRGGWYAYDLTTDVHALVVPINPGSWATLLTIATQQNQVTDGWQSDGNFNQLSLRSLAVAHMMMRDTRVPTLIPRIKGVAPFTDVARYRVEPLDAIAPLALVGSDRLLLPSPFGTATLTLAANTRLTISVPEPVSGGPIHQRWYRIKTSAGSTWSNWTPFPAGGFLTAMLPSGTAHDFQFRAENVEGYGTVTSLNNVATTGSSDGTGPTVPAAPIAAASTGFAAFSPVAVMVGQDLTKWVTVLDSGDVERTIGYLPSGAWDAAALAPYLVDGKVRLKRWWNAVGTNHLDSFNAYGGSLPMLNASQVIAGDTPTVEFIDWSVLQSQSAFTFDNVALTKHVVMMGSTQSDRVVASLHPTGASIYEDDRVIAMMQKAPGWVEIIRHYRWCAISELTEGVMHCAQVDIGAPGSGGAGYKDGVLGTTGEARSTQVGGFLRLGCFNDPGVQNWSGHLSEYIIAPTALITRPALRTRAKAIVDLLA